MGSVCSTVGCIAVLSVTGGFLALVLLLVAVARLGHFINRRYHRNAITTQQQWVTQGNSGRVPSSVVGTQTWGGWYQWKDQGRRLLFEMTIENGILKAQAKEDYITMTGAVNWPFVAFDKTYRHRKKAPFVVNYRGRWGEVEYQSLHEVEVRKEETPDILAIRDLLSRKFHVIKVSGAIIGYMFGTLVTVLEGTWTRVDMEVIERGPFRIWPGVEEEVAYEDGSVNLHISPWRRGSTHATDTGHTGPYAQRDINALMGNTTTHENESDTLLK